MSRQNESNMSSRDNDVWYLPLYLGGLGEPPTNPTAFVATTNNTSLFELRDTILSTCFVHQLPAGIKSQKIPFHFAVEHNNVMRDVHWSDEKNTYIRQSFYGKVSIFTHFPSHMAHTTPFATPTSDEERQKAHQKTRRRGKKAGLRALNYAVAWCNSFAGLRLARRRQRGR